LAEDGVFRVRKAVALNLHNVFKTTSDEVTRDRLLPAFLQLGQDDIWGVRKACAENLVSISEVVPAHMRAEHIVRENNLLNIVL
jgi:serine/threonine-protein phosphatase 4 regulatory subunit 1